MTGDACMFSSCVSSRNETPLFVLEADGSSLQQSNLVRGTNQSETDECCNSAVVEMPIQLEAQGATLTWEHHMESHIVSHRNCECPDAKQHREPGKLRPSLTVFSSCHRGRSQAEFTSIISRRIYSNRNLLAELQPVWQLAPRMVLVDMEARTQQCGAMLPPPPTQNESHLFMASSGHIREASHVGLLRASAERLQDGFTLTSNMEQRVDRVRTEHARLVSKKESSIETIAMKLPSDEQPLHVAAMVAAPMRHTNEASLPATWTRQGTPVIYDRLLDPEVTNCASSARVQSSDPNLPHTRTSPPLLLDFLVSLYSHCASGGIHRSTERPYLATLKCSKSTPLPGLRRPLA